MVVSLPELLATVRASNRFYASKLPAHATELSQLPFTTKSELIADQQAHPPYGTNLTYPLARYTRLHQTSGSTTGQPLRWLDTIDSWQSLLDCWDRIFATIALRGEDVMMFPFSFGPFLGFWTAFEAATRAGYRSLAAGGMTSIARLRMIFDHHVTVLFTTPTYALHLLETALQQGMDLSTSPVRLIVVAGEPGGNIPTTRQRIATGWQARVVDHYGLTEVGPVAIEPADDPNIMTILPECYIWEVIEPNGDRPTPDGAIGELVITTLHRIGSPLIRYRTGDLVQRDQSNRLIAGVIGRADDMLHIRGNNVYPSALEAIIRRFDAVIEYRIIVDHTGPLVDLVIEIELAPGSNSTHICEQISSAVQSQLLFRAQVRVVDKLPRFEMKAKRILHKKQI